MSRINDDVPWRIRKTSWRFAVSVVLIWLHHQGAHGAPPQLDGTFVGFRRDDCRITVADARLPTNLGTTLISPSGVTCASTTPSFGIFKNTTALFLTSLFGSVATVHVYSNFFENITTKGEIFAEKDLITVNSCLSDVPTQAIAVWNDDKWHSVVFLSEKRYCVNGAPNLASPSVSGDIAAPNKAAGSVSGVIAGVPKLHAIAYVFMDDKKIPYTKLLNIDLQSASDFPLRLSASIVPGNGFSIIDGNLLMYKAPDHCWIDLQTGDCNGEAVYKGTVLGENDMILYVPKGEQRFVSSAVMDTESENLNGTKGSSNNRTLEGGLFGSAERTQLYIVVAGIFGAALLVADIGAIAYYLRFYKPFALAKNEKKRKIGLGPKVKAKMIKMSKGKAPTNVVDIEKAKKLEMGPKPPAGSKAAESKDPKPVVAAASKDKPVPPKKTEEVKKKTPDDSKPKKAKETKGSSRGKETKGSSPRTKKTLRSSRSRSRRRRSRRTTVTSKSNSSVLPDDPKARKEHYRDKNGRVSTVNDSSCQRTSAIIPSKVFGGKTKKHEKKYKKETKKDNKDKKRTKKDGDKKRTRRSEDNNNNDMSYLKVL